MIKNEIVFPVDVCSRQATQLVRALSISIKKPIYFSKDTRTINAHSMLGLLSLDIKSGDNVSIISDTEKDYNSLIDIIYNL